MAVPTQGHAGQWNPWNRNFFPRGIADGSMTTPVGRISGSPLAVPRPNTPPYASPYDNAFFRFPQAGPQYSGGSPEEHAIVRYPRAGVPQNPAFAPVTQSAGAAQPQAMGTEGGGQPASSPYAVNATLDESGRPVYPAARSLVTPYNDTPVPSPLRAELATEPDSAYGLGGALASILQGGIPGLSSSGTTAIDSPGVYGNPGRQQQNIQWADRFARQIANAPPAIERPENQQWVDYHNLVMDEMEKTGQRQRAMAGQDPAIEAEIAQMNADWDAQEEAFGKAADSPLGPHGTALDPQYRNQALQANQGYVIAARNTDAWRKPEDRLYPYLGSDGSVQYMEPLAERQPTPYMQREQFDRKRMQNGTWQYGPMVGTQGMPTPVPETQEQQRARKEAEMRERTPALQARLRERAIERALYGQNADMTRYHPLSNPEGRIVTTGQYRDDGTEMLIDRKTGLPFYSSAQEKDAAKKRRIKHQAASKDRRRQKHNAARAANYARYHGMPMGTAQGIIGAMDRQRAGSPLSSDDRALLGMPDIERQIAEQRYLADRQNVAAVLGHYFGGAGADGLTPEQVMQILRDAGFASPLQEPEDTGPAPVKPNRSIMDRITGTHPTPPLALPTKPPVGGVHKPNPALLPGASPRKPSWFRVTYDDYGDSLNRGMDMWPRLMSGPIDRLLSPFVREPELARPTKPPASRAAR